MLRKTVLAIVVTAAFAALTAAPAQAAASARWTWSDPFPGTDLSGITFPDDSHGWVCGSGGLIATTADGGTTWTTQDSGITGYLVDIVFADADNGWAATAETEVLKTTDGGTTWTPVVVSGYSLKEIDFVDAAHGWALTYGGVYATSDGGDTWQPAGVSFGWSDGIDFFDLLHGASAGDSSYETSDGGVLWTGLWASLGSRSFIDVAYPDASAEFFLGQGYYGEGGVFVRNQVDPSLSAWVSFGAQLSSIAATDGQHAWVTSQSGAMYATADGGHTWCRQTVDSEHAMWDIVVRGDQGWACGAGITHSEQTGFTGMHAPVTSFVLPEYTNHSIEVPLTVSDAGGDVAVSYFRIGADPWASCTSMQITVPADHSADGVVSIEAYSTDAVGDVEQPVKQTMIIDTYGPSITKLLAEYTDILDATYKNGTWTKSPILVSTYNLFDPGTSSGGVKSQVNLNKSAAWNDAVNWVVTTPSDHSHDGVNTVRFRGIDNAGNAGESREMIVKVDTRRPIAKAPYVATGRAGGTSTVQCKIVDQKPCRSVGALAIVVSTLSGKTLGVVKPNVWFSVNKVITIRFGSSLKAGRYRFKVFVMDGSRNVAKRAASNYLIIKSGSSTSAFSASALSTFGTVPVFELQQADGMAVPGLF